MITFTAGQTTEIESTRKKTSWLFEITPVGQPTLYWSTKTITIGEQEYLFKINPDSFSGIRMPRNRTEAGIIPMPEMSFIANNFTTPPFSSTYFSNAVVVVRYLINEVECRTWKMVVRSCAPGFKTLAFDCEGFLKQYLKGDLPLSPKIIQLDPNYKGDENDCVPVLYGTAYLPLPCIIDNNQRHYLLGPTNLSQTYTVTAVHSPKAWNSSSEWLATGYTFNQAAMSVGSYRLLRPIINDSNADGTADACGLFPSGDLYLPIAAKFSCSRTASITDPALVIQDFLEQIGVSAGDIDIGTTSADLALRGIGFEGGWTRRQSAESFLAGLLVECNVEFDIRDKIYLRVVSGTSVLDIDNDKVLRDGNKSLWGYNLLTKSEYNAGHAYWSEDGIPADRPVGAVVSPDDSITNPSYERLDFNLIHDSILVQKLSCLLFQRQLLSIGQPRWKSPLSLLGLQPGDVVTIINDDYGAAGSSYLSLIDEITIESQGDTERIAVNAIRLSRLDDFDDLTFSALTIPEGAAEPEVIPQYVDYIYDPAVMTREEKNSILPPFLAFIAEKTTIDTAADSAGISRVAYDAAYDDLYTIVNPLVTTYLNDLYTAVNRTAFNDAWALLLTERTDLQQSITQMTVTSIDNISSDEILSIDEKPRVIQDVTAILADQLGIDNKADAFSITTEKTNYDNAITGLTDYLATLTSPVLWSNLSDNTTILSEESAMTARETFNQYFTDVYETRQILLTKIAENAINLVAATGTFVGTVKAGHVRSSSFSTMGSHVTSAVSEAAETINVFDASSFPASGAGAFMDTTNDRNEFIYTGKTATTLTGCSGVLAHNSGSTIFPMVKGVVIDAVVGEIRFFADLGGAYEWITEAASIGITTGAFGDGTIVGRSFDGQAIIGHDLGDGIGVTGLSDNAGSGVYGESVVGEGGLFTSTTGPGCYGVSDSGNGVQGVSTSGVGGSFSSTDSYGVNAASTDSNGLRGVSTNAAAVVGVATAGNYSFYATGGLGYGPFTGAHDGLILHQTDVEVGDILIDIQLIHIADASNTIGEVGMSTAPRQKGALGVAVSALIEIADDETIPAALLDGIYPIDACNGRAGYTMLDVLNTFSLIRFNGVGEGMLNVCAEGGDIEIGDLICTSSIPGKGMQQGDDIIRGYTVAKARDYVHWDDEPSTTKKIACIYLGG